VLEKFRRKAHRLIGVDLVEFVPGVRGVALLHGDLAAIPLEDESVDIVMARSVMEHVTELANVYFELYRVLRRMDMSYS
jgi:ubiquinone/menaquinone biosynthesis C-methylase UbiE